MVVKSLPGTLPCLACLLCSIIRKPGSNTAGVNITEVLKQGVPMVKITIRKTAGVPKRYFELQYVLLLLASSKGTCRPGICRGPGETVTLMWGPQWNCFVRVGGSELGVGGQDKLHIFSILWYRAIAYYSNLPSPQFHVYVCINKSPWEVLAALN